MSVGELGYFQRKISCVAGYINFIVQLVGVNLLTLTIIIITLTLSNPKS
jgi:hypothetical protein